jgi:hypothetical protein
MARRSAAAVVAVITRTLTTMGNQRRFRLQELDDSLNAGQRVIPILIGTSSDDLQNAPNPLPKLQNLTGFLLPENVMVPDEMSADWNQFVESLRRLLADAAELTPPAEVDPEDPNKGHFGGKPTRNGRTLSARVEEVEEDWYEIRLQVVRESGAPLIGKVKFHLHPTFDSDVRSVSVKDGRAIETVWAYGAFTVGAVADGGKTRLELDLATLKGTPRRFRDS